MRTKKPPAFPRRRLEVLRRFVSTPRCSLRCQPILTQCTVRQPTGSSLCLRRWPTLSLD